jgi:dynactin 4
MWTTLDIGIKFNKPTNIRSQLSRIYEEKGNGGSGMGGDLKSSSLSIGGVGVDDDDELESPTATAEDAEEKDDLTSLEHKHDHHRHVELDAGARFAALKRFYTKQIEDTSVSATDPLASDFGAAFSSPSTLSRIMSIYTSSSHLYGGGAKKAKSKPPVMREALTSAEGLKVSSATKERSIIHRMASDDCTWDDMLSKEQRSFQDPDARFMEELRPLPVLLRTKRSKRCKSCKHILVKPEFKPASTRFRIRLIALSYIPLPTLRPLMPAALPGQSVSATSILQLNLDALPPLRPVQYLLTLKNHMFDPVRVTLATPSITPGRIASKVTILCPQFDLGANSDVWDEALQAGPAAPTSSSIAAASSVSLGRPGATAAGYEKVAEAGKVWDKGRNWTTVVLEVVPDVLPGTKNPAVVLPSPQKQQKGEKEEEEEDDVHPLTEDEDVLEIPIFVHLEWDSDNQMDQDDGADKTQLRQKAGGDNNDDGEGGEKVKRELAYWMVLAVGRISSKLF